MSHQSLMTVHTSPLCPADCCSVRPVYVTPIGSGEGQQGTGKSHRGPEEYIHYLLLPCPASWTAKPPEFSRFKNSRGRTCNYRATSSVSNAKHSSKRHLISGGLPDVGSSGSSPRVFLPRHARKDCVTKPGAKDEPDQNGDGGLDSLI